jgi:hypothetical protein
MTKTLTTVVPADAGRGLELEKITPALVRLITPAKEQVFFWNGTPIAAFNGAYVYTYGRPTPGQLRALSPWTSTNPTISQPIDDFEYTIGQILSKAGLQLVRRLEP